MQYRRDYQAPAARERYALSRWAGELPELFAHRLDAALAGSAERLPCRLEIELDEALQVFDSPEQSRAEWHVRALLVPARNGAPVAQRALSAASAAETPDAGGGVAAHRAAVDALLAQIGAWLEMAGSDPDLVARCRKAS